MTDFKTVYSPLAFAGDTETTGKGDTQLLGTQDFLDEMERRRTLAGNTWTQEQAIDHATAAFRGSAAAWWTDSVSMGRDPEDNDHKTNWATFLAIFKRSYSVKPALSGLDWKDIETKKSAEDSGSYGKRIHAKVAHTYNQHHAKNPKSILDPSAVQYKRLSAVSAAGGRAAELINDKYPPGTAENAQLNTGISDLVQYFLALQRHKDRASFAASLVKELVTNRCPAAMRPKAIELGVKEDDIHQYFHDLTQAEMAHNSTRTTNHHSQKQQIQYINELGEVIDSEQVDAIRAKAKTNNKSKDKAAKAALQCTHCEKRGHTWAHCFKRLGTGRYAKNAKPSVSEVADPGGVSAAAVLYNSMPKTTASGNAYGEW